MFHAALAQAFEDTALVPHLEALTGSAETAWCATHGDRLRWEEALHRLPALPVASVRLRQPKVTAAGATPLDGSTRDALTQCLQAFQPWRKGPFELFGIHLDTEWRSDWKWARVEKHLPTLEGALVLDVGCGNGYYGYRMLGAGARAVLGIDPFLLFHYQHRALQQYIGQPRLVHLPIAFEDLPERMRLFDHAFSMGVLYHRRDPHEHLRNLRDCLHPGGSLILETLIVEGAPSLALSKGDRYARMRNVWHIPNIKDLRAWLASCGFEEIQVLDVSPTRPEEQRTTHWMPFESLRESLEPKDASRTVEGYPAPVRAVLSATAP